MNGPRRLAEGRYREWQLTEPATKIGDILPQSQDLRIEHQGAIGEGSASPFREKIIQ
jgi:hypothetical protein